MAKSGRMRDRPSDDQLTLVIVGVAPNHRISLLHARSCDVPPSLLRGSGVDCAATRPDVLVRGSRMTAGWRYVVAGVGLAMGVLVAVGLWQTAALDRAFPLPQPTAAPDRHRHGGRPRFCGYCRSASVTTPRPTSTCLRRRRRPRAQRPAPDRRPARALPRGTQPGAHRRAGDPREHALRPVAVSRTGRPRRRRGALRRRPRRARPRQRQLLLPPLPGHRRHPARRRAADVGLRRVAAHPAPEHPRRHRHARHLPCRFARHPVGRRRRRRTRWRAR